MTVIATGFDRQAQAGRIARTRDTTIITKGTLRRRRDGTLKMCRISMSARTSLDIPTFLRDKD